MSDCRRRVRAECGATARLRELREERMQEYRELRASRTVNHPDVRRGLLLVLISGLSTMIAFLVVAIYLVA